MVGEPAAAARGRRWLEAKYGSRLDGRELDAAKLRASELINNAFLHGHGMITLRAGLDENRLLVEVIDEGSGFERILEKLTSSGSAAAGSRSSRRGPAAGACIKGTTHVWFEIERPGPRLGAARKPPLP